MEALHEGLQVDVVGPALLTFQGTVDGIHAAEDTSHGGCTTAKSIHAGAVGLRAVGTIPTETHAKEVAQRQQH